MRGDHRSTEIGRYFMRFCLIYFVFAASIAVILLLSGMVGFPGMTTLVAVFSAIATYQKFVKNERRYLSGKEILKLTVFGYVFHLAVQVACVFAVASEKVVPSIFYRLLIFGLAIDAVAIYLVYKYAHKNIPLPS